MPKKTKNMSTISTRPISKNSRNSNMRTVNYSSFGGNIGRELKNKSTLIKEDFKTMPSRNNNNRSYISQRELSRKVRPISPLFDKAVESY